MSVSDYDSARRLEHLGVLAKRMTDEIVVTNLANTATEWHSCRPHEANLYAVGMGMVTPYALGIALSLPHRRVVALDGDGGIFFDLSILGILAHIKPANLTVIVFDNGGYVSTGKLPGVGSLSHSGVEIESLARSAGLNNVVTTRNVTEFARAIDDGTDLLGPRIIIAKVNARQGFVGTLPMDLKENKYRFVRHIEATEKIKILKPSAKEHGARPPADPVSKVPSAGEDFASVLFDGMRENGVDFAIGLPCSGFVGVQEALMADPEVIYVSVANEGTGLAICAGAWLSGRRCAAIIENFGLFASVYQLLRGHLSYGLPTLIVSEFRGDAGDQEFFAEGGEVTLDILKAMRINHRLVTDIQELKPAIRDALRWMDGCLRPFALVPSFELTRQRK